MSYVTRSRLSCAPAALASGGVARGPLARGHWARALMEVCPRTRGRATPARTTWLAGCLHRHCLYLEKKFTCNF